VWNETFTKIKLELNNLHKLLSTYPSLLESLHFREPDHVEIMALASILHSFYMGFENIFKRIATEIDGGLIKTESWHIDLLESMVIPSIKRSAVLSCDTERKLRFYLSFRHVFRSHYSYDLNWSKMKSLVLQSNTILVLVESELQAFMSKPGP